MPSKQLRNMRVAVMRIQSTLATKEEIELSSQQVESYQLSNYQDSTGTLKLKLKSLQKYKRLQTRINPIYILAISMIGVYQSDIEFRKVAFVSMQDAFYSFMSINGDNSPMYFDESQVELINYLSKHGINKLVKRVLDTIKSSIPDI